MIKTLIFTASWCNPCKQLHKRLDNLTDKTKELNIEYIDIEENTELCEKHNIMNVPTILVYNDKNNKSVKVENTTDNNLLIEQINKAKESIMDDAC